jgi:calcium-dependent protein kinase
MGNQVIQTNNKSEQNHPNIPTKNAIAKSKEDTHHNEPEPKKEIKFITDKPDSCKLNAPKDSENIVAKSPSRSDKGKINLITTAGSLAQDIRQTYKFKDVLGGGHFGTVRIGYKRNEVPRKLYAIKSISKKNLSAKDLDDLMKEVEIISQLDHPNIVKLLETYHDQYYFHLVMELCTGKEVFDRIIEEGHINEFKVATIIYKVVSAIVYCHNQGITHRDIKPENILFETPDADSEIKLIDFGLSRKYDPNQKMHTILGTPYYVAPEVLKGEYDNKCDIWSIGAIAYIMLSGEPPFNGTSNHEIFNKIIHEEVSFPKNRWKNVSEDGIDFIRQCMMKDPEKRISAQKAVTHPWFNEILKSLQKSTNLDAELLINLKNFSSPSKFKKLVLMFLVNQLSHKDINKLRQTFYAMDINQQGQINLFELENAFKQAGISVSEEELKKIIEMVNEENDGVLDYSEFLVACLNQKKFVDKEKLIYAFNYFDIDGSGYIDASDLKNALLRSGKKILNTEDIEAMIEEVAHKEKISLEEFLGLFDMK